VDRFRAPVRLLSLLSILSLTASVVCAQQQNPYANNRLGNPAVPDPVPFKSKDGKFKGWKVVLPGNRALATPAVADGKVFLGGGFGSHEFYAFDAITGKKIWVYRTKDDGPTAAGVSDGHVVFNTESCELEVLTLEGKPVWKKWLGDPLMSMPAVTGGRVYMAYPDSKGDRKHYLACFDLKKGDELWKNEIAGEIITAPILDDQVYLSTLEGTLYCFSTDGKLVWSEKKNVTSAPILWKDRCYFSRRAETSVTRGGKLSQQQNEELAKRGQAVKSLVEGLEQTRCTADYLDYKLRVRSKMEGAYQDMDANAGFPLANKGDAKLDQAKDNIGQNSVAGVWSYQGSRPSIVSDRLYIAMGDTLKCLDLKTERIVWKKDLHPVKDRGELLDAVLTPPALVNGKVFLGTAHGDVICLSAEKGDLLWKAEVGEPIVFQPAVAGGRVYVATSSGSLICLETGDDKDDGWLMWGANAAHNGKVKETLLTK
jgi:Ca-activated chloride channel family protein